MGCLLGFLLGFLKGFRLGLLLGFLLGFLLVFRTQTGYERYYEGRKLVGSMCNAMREMVSCVYCHEDRPGLSAADKQAARDNDAQHRILSPRLMVLLLDACAFRAGTLNWTRS